MDSYSLHTSFPSPLPTHIWKSLAFLTNSSYLHIELDKKSICGWYHILTDPSWFFQGTIHRQWHRPSVSKGWIQERFPENRHDRDQTSGQICNLFKTGKAWKNPRQICRNGSKCLTFPTSKLKKSDFLGTWQLDIMMCLFFVWSTSKLYK